MRYPYLTPLQQAELLRARWMEESDRYEMSEVYKVFQQATELWQKSVPLIKTFAYSNIITDGKVGCFTMGSTKTVVSTAYHRPTS